MRGLLSFFLNDSATTEIYTLSLHDALPISGGAPELDLGQIEREIVCRDREIAHEFGKDMQINVMRQARNYLGDKLDRKSTRLNSSHANISYAVFYLNKKQRSTTHL